MNRKKIGKYIKHPKDIFFGWWMTLAGGLLCLWGYGFQVYGFSALFKPISRELGFSRTTTSVAASIARFEGGIEAPLVGWLSDKYGPKITILFGVFLTGLGLIAMNWINSIWSFYLVWAVICSTGTNIALSMPLDVAITNWFVKKRGTATGIKWVFSGLSGTIGLPLISWLIVSFGWRWACVVGGLVMWGVGLPLVWFFIRSRRPEYYGLLPDGVSTESEETEEVMNEGIKYALETGEVEFTAKEALHTKAFWLIILAYSFHGALYPVMNIHCIPFLTDRGMDPLLAAATMSIFVTASIPARFLGGVITDRVGKSHIRFLLAGAFMMQCAGVTLFLFNQQSMVALYTFFVLYGVGMGTTMPMTPVMRARYFGRKNFGVIAGISRIFHMPVGIVGPIAAGWIYDVTGSYISAFTLFAVLLGISALIIVAAAPPKK
ncbi:MAG: MFS transporter [Proteobacteria bacterium]|nr:MFS transporter [Pseudomonadota bacterium]